jgi:hypothetical protein
MIHRQFITREAKSQMDLLINIGMVLGLLGMGMGISEYYHRRIDRARREGRPMDQPDMWDLTPLAPQPRAVISSADYRQMQKGGRITKMVQGGGRG